MRVWIDLANSPHPLLFAPVARRLTESGAKVLVTARDHAETAELARERFPDASVIGGQSPGGRLRKVGVMGGRVAALARWARQTRPDVALSHNSYGQLLAARVVRVPSVTAMDFEHQPANHVAFRVAARVLLPAAIPAGALRRQGVTRRKVVRYPGLKEELYLGDFTPDGGILARLGIDRPLGSALIVARTPPARALYHRFGNPLFLEALQMLGRQQHVRCVVLARHPEQREEIEGLGLPNCTVPGGAVDARSLLHEADLFIGAGGTMTREAALMGVPTYTAFAGARPAVDSWLEEQGALRSLESPEQLTQVRPRSEAPASVQALRARALRIEEVFVDATLRVARNGLEGRLDIRHGRSRGATSATVPFVDLERQNEPIGAELAGAFARVAARGDFVLGEELGLFESEFADYIGTAEAIGVGSGTAALTIAVRGAGIGHGDEVLVPTHTYIASALGVVHAGAVPMFCDVDEETGLIDLESAASVVTERTAAVVAVHLYGQSCDMDAVREFAERHGLAVIEDAAQAHGASWRARKAGSHGLVSAFSFYPSKNLGALGDGGMVCTADSDIAERARRLRNLGQRGKGEHTEAGYNSRLDTLQAAALRIKLRSLDRWNELRREAAARYRAQLPAGVRTLPERAAAHDVYHLFPIRIGHRDEVRRALGDSGIETGVHYSPPVHLQPPFKGPEEPLDLPVAERWAREELSLPMFPGLEQAEITRVCNGLAGAE